MGWEMPLADLTNIKILLQWSAVKVLPVLWFGLPLYKHFMCTHKYYICTQRVLTCSVSTHYMCVLTKCGVHSHLVSTH